MASRYRIYRQVIIGGKVTKREALGRERQAFNDDFFIPESEPVTDWFPRALEAGRAGRRATCEEGLIDWERDARGYGMYPFRRPNTGWNNGNTLRSRNKHIDY